MSSESDVTLELYRSEWATPLIIVPKNNGNIRVFGDLKVTINQCVETKLYPLPNVEDIFARLARGKIFTKLDITNIPATAS